MTACMLSHTTYLAQMFSRALAVLALGLNAFLRLALGVTGSICFRLEHGAGYIFPRSADLAYIFSSLILNANAFERLAVGACLRLAHAWHTMHRFSRALHSADGTDIFPRLAHGGYIFLRSAGKAYIFLRLVLNANAFARLAPGV